MLGDPLMKIFPLEHLLQRDPAIEANDIFETHCPEPVAITDNLGAHWIENFERLFSISFGISQDFIVRQVGTGDRTTTRVANHPGEVADDEDGLVTEILKLPKFTKD